MDLAPGPLLCSNTVKPLLILLAAPARHYRVCQYKLNACHLAMCVLTPAVLLCARVDRLNQYHKTAATARLPVYAVHWRLLFEQNMSRKSIILRECHHTAEASRVLRTQNIEYSQWNPLISKQLGPSKLPLLGRYQVRNEPTFCSSSFMTS